MPHRTQRLPACPQVPPAPAHTWRNNLELWHLSKTLLATPRAAATVSMGRWSSHSVCAFEGWQSGSNVVTPGFWMNDDLPTALPAARKAEHIRSETKWLTHSQCITGELSKAAYKVKRWSEYSSGTELVTAVQKSLKQQVQDDGLLTDGTRPVNVWKILTPNMFFTTGREHRWIQSK